jgi:hypothetical protein
MVSSLADAVEPVTIKNTWFRGIVGTPVFENLIVFLATRIINVKMYTDSHYYLYGVDFSKM